MIGKTRWIYLGATVVGLATMSMAQVGLVGSVKRFQKINRTEGGFTGVLHRFDRLGSATASLGDLDGDGVPDLAIGAPYDDDDQIQIGGNNGAVWVLFMDAAGTVKSQQKISETAGGFANLIGGDHFGSALASLGDLDGDGVTDLAVGAPGDGFVGAVWVLFLNANGTVKAQQKISDTEGGFTGILHSGDNLGSALAPLGDFDGDGTPDLAVGAPGDDDGENNSGAIYVLFLRADGSVKAHQKIAHVVGGLPDVLEASDSFGTALACLGDFDGDGTPDLAVGATGDDDGGGERGAVYVLFLKADGTVKAQQKISDIEGGFAGVLDDGDLFGTAASSSGDLDGDGLTDLVIGTDQDDDGASDLGAIWLLFLEADGTVKAHQKISKTEGGFGELELDFYSAGFGKATALSGDLDGDGMKELVVGAFEARDADSTGVGAVYVLFLNKGPAQSTPPTFATPLGLGLNLVSLGPDVGNDSIAVITRDLGTNLDRVLGFENPAVNPNAPRVGGLIYDPSLDDFITYSTTGSAGWTGGLAGRLPLSQGAGGQVD